MASLSHSLPCERGGPTALLGGQAERHVGRNGCELFLAVRKAMMPETDWQSHRVPSCMFLTLSPLVS